MGAGVAAPWPMPVAAVVAAATPGANGRRRDPARSARGSAGLGCIVGTLSEPVTRRPESWPPTTGLAIGINVAAAAALIGTGLRHTAAARPCQRPSATR